MKDRFGGYEVDIVYSTLDKDYLAYLVGVPDASISAFGETEEAALKELDVSWSLYQEGAWVFDKNGGVLGH